MKRKIAYCLFVVFLLPVLGCENDSSVAPNYQDYFVKYYGNEGNQEGVDLVILDEGFAVLGTSKVNSRSTVVLVITDQLGNEVSEVEMGGNAAEANAIDLEASGNFVIAATNTVSVDDKDILIFRISPDGNLLDSLSFGAVNEIEEANDITITNQGDIIVVGSTTNVDIGKAGGFNPTTDFEDIYSIRLDPNFVPYNEADWRKVTGFEGTEEGTNILQKEDGTFLFFGTTNKPSSSQQDGFNMFLYPAGDDGEAISVTQLQLFGTISDESASQMVKTADGGYAMIGTSNSGNENDIFLARVRSNNEFLSAGLLNSGKNLLGASIVESAQGGLLLLGRDIVNNTGDILLTKTTVSGAILWQQSFGGVDDDYPGIVKELDDGSIIVVGTIDLESQSKICLIKTTPTGKLKK